MSEPAEIFLSTKNRQLKSRDFSNEAEFNAFLSDNSLQAGSILHAGAPYIVRSSQSSKPTNLMQQCRQLQTIPSCHRRSLANVNAQLGSDITLGLAELFDQQIAPAASQLNQWVNKEKFNFSSAGVGLLESRGGALEKSLKAYEKSLMAVRAGHQAKLPKMQMMKLESSARAAFKSLNQLFSTELSKATAVVKARKGTALNNATRGINKAKSARTDAPIRVTNVKELQSLKRMSLGLKAGGNILLGYDVYARGKMVQADFEQGKDWGKTAVVQTSGLAAGIIAGTITANAMTTAAITIGLTATPVGWVIAICIGIGATYLATKTFDGIGQKMATQVYEREGMFNRIPRTL
ncbi:hypothetical protein M0C34_03535 [Agarivorans sp. TSD2052]|uniref:hypothetical protein n=1 Tax=Agarivorans sp. TSD2052 TaxID=2937286 RepID=UPI00200CAD55|nr:hypothetical protein [Agarivorans sp. TSD2052]UPW19362.1 hypothetical protein M0C34_03535 [Agarivorans sp. TSD2052]